MAAGPAVAVAKRRRTFCIRGLRSRSSTGELVGRSLLSSGIYQHLFELICFHVDVLADYLTGIYTYCFEPSVREGTLGGFFPLEHFIRF
jgi:hypothetical protein